MWYIFKKQDKYKDDLAINYGYVIFRVKESEIRNINILSNHNNTDFVLFDTILHHFVLFM